MGGYVPPEGREENMAGSDQAMSSSSEHESSSASSQSASSQSEHECSECQSDGDGTPSNHDDSASSGTDGGGTAEILPDITGVTGLLSPLLAGGTNLMSGDEPLDPVTNLVAEVCDGNLQTLDPGLGVGELGDTCASCVDKVAGPAGDLAGSVVEAGSSTLMTVGDALGLSNTTQGIACVLDSLGIGNIGSHTGGGVVADIVNLPHDILSGANIGTSIGNILSDAAITVGDEVPGLPIVLLKDLGTPLLGLNLDDDGQSSSGSYVASADVGPQQDNGLLINLLAPGGQSGHAADANVIEGRSVVDANLLNSGEAITFPALGGIGTDSLEGLLGGSTLPQVGGIADLPTTNLVDDVLAALSIDGLLDSSHQASNQPSSLLHGLV